MTHEEAAAALDACRHDIDAIDRRIADLLNQRARIVESIGDIKQKVEMPVYEPKREDAVYDNISRNNAGPLRSEALKRIYERIIDEMRTLQRDRMAQRAAGNDGGPAAGQSG
jgi:chorismate mutase-like protein